MRTTLITDVDNTLFDWQEMWLQTFSAMMDEVIRISGIDPELLYSEVKVVHQKYGTSEYSGLLEELPTLKALYGKNLAVEMSPAIDAFRAARRSALRLYPTVLNTLQELKKRGVVIAAFTESKAFYTVYRFKKLGLDGLIDVLYSPRDHEVRDEILQSRRYTADRYELTATQHHFTPDGEVKPNPGILKSILGDLSIDADQAVYVGDNLLKDVYMAKQAQVLDVHAAYGAAQHRPEYELLRKVTHWTPEMVEHERNAIRPGVVEPSIVLRNFEDILSLY